MSDDQQTYKRALSAALAGLGTQVALTVVMALVGIYAEAPGIHAATLHLLGGVPIWIILAILFHQQRQERIEALEAEQLAEADAATAAIFNEAGDQLRYARKRLNNLIKYWLNIISLTVAVYLLAVGGYYLVRAGTNAEYILAVRGIGTSAAAAAQGIRPTASPAVITIVALAIGFVAFLIARYVAGMTRVRAWQPLRGGAGYLMGSALVAALIAAAALLRYFGVAVPGFVLLLFIIPGVMLLLGVEIVLRFIFGLYRPRKPGEAPQPAFESRLLGWLTRPESIGKIVSETLNYQFGFEISSSWFYRLLARAIVPLIALGGLVLLGLSSAVIVGPHQNAVVTRFGELRLPVLQPGLHWKLPWPIERARKYDVYQVQSIDIASSTQERLERDVAVLWTNEHGGQETQLFVTAEPVSRGEGESGDAIAAGLIGVRVTVQYRIADLEAYVGAESAVNPQELFHRKAEGAVSAFFATHEIDDLLSRARVNAEARLREWIQEQARGLGIEVLMAAIVSLHPPQAEDVATSFLSRIQADIEKQAMIEEARKDEVTALTQVAGSREMAMQIRDAIIEADRLQAQINRAETAGGEAAALAEQLAEQQVRIERLMDEAGGEAVSLIHAARAHRWAYALGERARMMRLRSKYLAYQQAPDYFRMREYLAVLAEELNDPERPTRKFILTVPDADAATIRLNLEDQEVELGASAWETGE